MKDLLDLMNIILNGLLFVGLVRNLQLQLLSKDRDNYIFFKKVMLSQLIVTFSALAFFVIDLIEYGTFTDSFMWLVVSASWGALSYRYYKKYKEKIPRVVKTEFECYEMHAYSRFAGCGSQCKECKEKQNEIQTKK